MQEEEAAGEGGEQELHSASGLSAALGGGSIAQYLAHNPEHHQTVHGVEQHIVDVVPERVLGLELEIDPVAEHEERAVTGDPEFQISREVVSDEWEVVIIEDE